MIDFFIGAKGKMSKKREEILTTIGILIIILIPTNVLADPNLIHTIINIMNQQHHITNLNHMLVNNSL